eukprot:TRINITY_DN3703_c0_g1_i1.p1 TRINITY_DN3703_c0_g1~~TRINITY_DN3703_c0_g1_i1.p1  ORF type:complete len:225 (+),score=52.87 TRINITY_DN3703_c0_g1_i1:82-756(+)
MRSLLHTRVGHCCVYFACTHPRRSMPTSYHARNAITQYRSDRRASLSTFLPVVLCLMNIERAKRAEDLPFPTYGRDLNAHKEYPAWGRAEGLKLAEELQCGYCELSLSQGINLTHCLKALVDMCKRCSKYKVGDETRFPQIFSGMFPETISRVIWTPLTHKFFPDRTREMVHMMFMLQSTPGCVLQVMPSELIVEIIQCLMLNPGKVWIDPGNMDETMTELIDN